MRRGKLVRSFEFMEPSMLSSLGRMPAGRGRGWFHCQVKGRSGQTSNSCEGPC